jgi:hypothetical protein
MNPLALACSTLALAGAILFAFSAITLVSWRSINADAFITQVRKLLDSGNRERALKLCSVVPNHPLVAFTVSMLTAKIPLEDPNVSAGAHFRDPAVQRSFHERVLSEFAGARAEQLARVRPFVFRASIGASIIAAGALGFLLAAPENRGIGLAALAFGLLAGAYPFLVLRSLERGLSLALDRLAPHALAEDDTTPLREEWVS